MGLRAGLDDTENLCSTGIRFPDRPALSESVYRLHYAGRHSVCMRIIIHELSRYVTVFHTLHTAFAGVCNIYDLLFKISTFNTFISLAFLLSTQFRVGHSLCNQAFSRPSYVLSIAGN